MQFIKTIIKRSPQYGAIKWFRVEKESVAWTAHDQKMLEFYSQFISRGALCFDVGANRGNRVKIFLKLHENIVAIEPQNNCVKILRTGYGNNKRLTVVQKALGESEGEAEIMISNANSISSLSPEWVEAVRHSRRFSEYRWNMKQIVPLTTLDGRSSNMEFRLLSKLMLKDLNTKSKWAVSTRESSFSGVHSRIHRVYIQMHRPSSTPR